MTTLPTVATGTAIKKLAALIASASMFATSSAAGPAAVEATFDFHSSPSTSHGSFGSIREGSPLDVSGYDSSGGALCDFFGKDSSANGKYIHTKQFRPPWLSSFMTSNGATPTLSQPQFIGCPAFTELNASVDAKLNHGVISVGRKTAAHDDTEAPLVITSLKATDVDLSGRDVKKLTIPSGRDTASQERLAAGHGDYKWLGDVRQSDLPKIFGSHVPASFVRTDGKKASPPIELSARLQFVGNTNHTTANDDAWRKSWAPLLAPAGNCAIGIKAPSSVYKSSNCFTEINFGVGAFAPPISPTPSASSSTSGSTTPIPHKTPSLAQNTGPTSTPPPVQLSAHGIVVLGRNFPNETNTGVPENVKASLTPYSGPCTIIAANVTIDRKVITCDQLRLLGPNATITNSIINGTVHSDCCYLNGSFSLTDSEVRGPNSTATVIGEVRFKLLRVEVSGGSRSVNCNTTCEIRDSYIHGQYGDKRGIDHESGIRQGSYGTFVHNTISCNAIAYPNPNGGEGSGCSAAVSGYGDFGTVNNNTFTNNLIESREALTGQAASSYCVYGGSTSGKPYPNAHHIVFTNNIFRRGTGKCGIYGPVTSFDSNAEGSLWQNNVWDDGATVPPTN